MPILNYTTQVDFYKTIGEIQKTLNKLGANKILIDNDGEFPAAISFSIILKRKHMPDMPMLFRLPCNFDKVLISLQNDRKVSRKFCTREQSLRVGWRILKDWIEAQAAIIQTEMVETAEVFLPYAISDTGDTLYSRVTEGSIKMLTQ